MRQQNTTLTIQISEAMKEEAKAKAARANTSISKIIRVMLQWWLDDAVSIGRELSIKLKEE